MKDNDALIDYLVDREIIKTDKVEKAFRKVDRAEFVTESYRSRAYEDRALPIGPEETISAPHMVAINTELLGLEENDRVVEIGAGSGYQLAIIAQIADKVTGVEISEKLVEKSREKMADLGIENVELIEGSGLEPVSGSFDKILFSCAISQDRFEETQGRIAENGVLVAPIKTGTGQIVKKFGDREITEHGQVSFVEFKE